MDALDRNITAARGARFFRADDGEVMYEFIMDPTNRIGPRPALRADQQNHAEAWRLFSKTEGADGPLDLDASGEPGGSLPVEAAPEPEVQPASAKRAPRAKRKAKA